MRAWGRTALAGAVATSVMAAGADAQSPPAKPRADYWVSADTVSGMMAGMAGAQPSLRGGLGAMMGMATGRAPQLAHTLKLQLGSTGTAAAPAADHLPPQTLGAGQALPLLTQRTQPTTPSQGSVPGMADGHPRGRMLFFWGCGERARPGQPLVVDFANLQAGKIPPAFANQPQLNTQQPPSPASHRTYGEWPNERTRTSVPANGSLVGEHVVRGNYSPEIRFTLNQGQDFLGAINLNSQARTAAGAVRLGWGQVANARAYAAMAMGAGANDTMVIWSSSDSQLMPFALNDYLSGGDITRLVNQKVLMPGTQTQCAVPQEAVAAMNNAGMLTMMAYGDEANFAYPPRPSDPAAARRWVPEWTAKVRRKSTHMAMLGMDMGAMGAMQEDGSSAGGEGQGQAQRPPQRPETPAERARRVLRNRLPFP